MTAKTDTTLHFKLQKELKADFKKACDSQDLNPSQVLRKFMREYAEQHNKNQSDKT